MAQLRPQLNLGEIIALLGRDPTRGGESTFLFLEDAAASFLARPARAIREISGLRARDPSGFALGAARLLAARGEEKSPIVRYISKLMSDHHLLIDLLMDERVLTPDTSLALAAKLSGADPHFDVHLMHAVLADPKPERKVIRDETILHVLGLVGAISDCSRLAALLVQLLSHPNPAIRSKAALLMGRANLNVTRVKQWLSSHDGRLRANALEGLWGHRTAKVRGLLWDAVKDSTPRVVINALVGLCLAKDPRAQARLIELAKSPDAAMRGSAAWAMGRIDDRIFTEALDRLAEDPDEKVRSMADRGRLKQAAPAATEPRPETPR